MFPPGATGLHLSDFHSYRLFSANGMPEMIDKAEFSGKKKPRVNGAKRGEILAAALAQAHHQRRESQQRGDNP